ncbi:MAG: TonB-dependent receptor [Bacteroidetes bacterium]|nr:TonB-dependent receptor [Bacteroidota bacterium]
MKQLLCLSTSFLFCFFSLSAKAQKHTISGYISDAETGEMLIGANLYDFKSESGTVSNTYGFYSLTLEADSVYLTASYVGYQPQTFALYLNKDAQIDISLSPSVSLQTVEVVASAEGDPIEERTQMSSVSIPVQQIKKLPAFLGETDVLKALQLLPGVQSGGEGQSGLYVRGGSPDQNLILLDGVPVYNASHLFGFFSVFNPDALRDITLIKGGFPARYGGRLSSVLDINMKEGNLKEFKGSGSIGMVASKLTLEGPIITDKTSFIVSGRRTYIDLLARPLIKRGFESGGGEGVAGYYFYDMNAKVNHKFSDKDRLYLSFYSGRDKFYLESEERFGSDRYKQELGFGWGNITSAIRYNHLWGKRLFSNLTLTYSKYNFNTSADQEDTYTEQGETITDGFGVDYDSGIEDLAAKIDFDFVPNPQHFIRFGGSLIRHRFDPGTFTIGFQDADTKLDTTFGQQIVYANEFAFYAEDDFEIGSRFKVNAGLHFSGFAVENGKIYTSLQPRLGMRYLFPGSWALKGSFATMQQYVQFLTNENLSLPTDLWLPTTDRVKPQQSWQVAAGIAKTFRETYEVSLEGYYKQMDNVISYSEGASFISFGDWQDNVTQGDGEAYGAELLIRKKQGKLTGWVGYTLNWTWRRFDDINFGEKYPYKYDRRHDISIVGIYDFNDRVSLSATWVYGSGNAYTLGEAVYTGYFPGGVGENSYASGFFTQYFQERNNQRTPAYHRFDIGVSFSKQKRLYKRTWAFGFYNLYNRNNPFFLYLDTVPNDSGTGQRTALKQISIFPVIPYINWSFEF